MCALCTDEMGLRQGLKPDEKLGVGSLALAGGIAGCAFWGPVYPADIIKSKIQVDSFTNPQYKGVIDCAIKVRPKFDNLCVILSDSVNTFRNPCVRTFWGCGVARIRWILGGASVGLDCLDVADAS